MSRSFIVHVLACAASATLPACAGPVRAEIGGGNFTRTGADTTPRFLHRAGSIATGDVLVSGGMRIEGLSLASLADLSFYDPASGEFSASFRPTGGGPPTEPALATPRSSHTQTALLDGRVLFTGGHVGAAGTDPGAPSRSVELFETATGVVTAGPAMSTARAAHTATALADGRVVVAGGGTWQVFLPGAGGTDAWSAERPLNHARTGHAAVTLSDERVLLVGGAGDGGATLEILDPDGPDETLSAATLDVAVDDLAAVLLDGGMVLIVGGQDLGSGDTIGDTFLYDSTADALAPVASPPGLASGISDHQLVALGRYALCVGGEQQVSGVDTELDYAALFDGAAGSWIWSSSMNGAHDDAAAVALADGSVLVIDGGVPFLGRELPTDACELFVPQRRGRGVARRRQG